MGMFDGLQGVEKEMNGLKVQVELLRKSNDHLRQTIEKLIGVVETWEKKAQ